MHAKCLRLMDDRTSAWSDDQVCLPYIYDNSTWRLNITWFCIQLFRRPFVVYISGNLLLLPHGPPTIYAFICYEASSIEFDLSINYRHWPSDARRNGINTNNIFLDPRNIRSSAQERLTKTAPPVTLPHPTITRHAQSLTSTAVSAIPGEKAAMKSLVPWQYNQSISNQKWPKLSNISQYRSQMTTYSDDNPLFYFGRSICLTAMGVANFRRF